MAGKRIRTRKQWQEFCHRRGTDGSQVFAVLDDWKITNREISEALTDIRDIARSGLPSSGLTVEQSQQMKLNDIARNLSAMIDALEAG